jgi:hypothetical protein
VISHKPLAQVQQFLAKGEPTQLAAFLRHQGSVKGGVIGEIRGRTLNISTLWVDPLFQQRGDGSRLVLSIEKRARICWAKNAAVSTLSFQAPHFYPKIGYTRRAELQDCPIVGTSTHVLRKQIESHVILPDAIQVEEHPEPADVETVEHGLQQHNEAAGPPIRHEYLSVHWEDAAGAIVAGVVGTIYGDWLQVHGVNLTPALAGSKPELVANLEDAAAKRGVRAYAVGVGKPDVTLFISRGFSVLFDEEGNDGLRFFMVKDPLHFTE